MLRYGNTTRRITQDSLSPAEMPGWISGSEQLPAIGDQVQCAEGAAEVVRILGKTGDGSRLLELTIPERPKQPFFAAASNVLVQANGRA